MDAIYICSELIKGRTAAAATAFLSAGFKRTPVYLVNSFIYFLFKNKTSPRKCIWGREETMWENSAAEWLRIELMNRLIRLPDWLN